MGRTLEEVVLSGNVVCRCELRLLYDAVHTRTLPLFSARRVFPALRTFTEAQYEEFCERFSGATETEDCKLCTCDPAYVPVCTHHSHEWRDAEGNLIGSCNN